MIVVVGGGPSISKTNLDLIKDKYVLGVNFAFTLGNWVDSLIFGDCRLYESWGYKDLIDSFPGQKYTLCEKLKDDPRFIVYKKCDKHFFCQEKNKLGWRFSFGPNTGSSAINLAVRLALESNIKKVVLVGFDGQAKKGQHNFHSYHKHTPNKTVYYKFQKHFKGLAEDLKEVNIEVLNATPGTVIDSFPKVKLEDIV
jgi:hypothetical protein